MRLEDITAELRPRSNWEAADLGAALVRRDFGAILLRQAVLVFPLWLFLVVVFFQHPGWALFFLWWLKPLYERVTLFYVSKRLFGEHPTLKETVRAAPKMFFRDLFMVLVMTRLSSARSAFQPVNQLEGLRWGNYLRRTKVLRQYATGSGVTMVMALLEVGLVMGLLGLAALLMPFSNSIDWRDLTLTMLRFEAGTIPADVFWTFNAFVALAVFLLAPFYAGAGFAIYINARTLLEGWDIELALRRLGDRLAPKTPTLEPGGEAVGQNVAPPGAGRTSAGKAAVLGLILFATGIASGIFVPATSSAAVPDRVIEEVLNDPDFEIHKETRKLPKLEVKDRNIALPNLPSTGFSQIGTALFYILLAAGIGWLLWVIWSNRHSFFGEKDAGARRKARTIMGMEVGAESLPDDIPAAALAAWEAGDIHRAVSLLYRGAICWLVECGNVSIRESDTEQDCLARIHAELPDQARRDFFEEVTGHWIFQAYGSVPPPDPEFRSACARWPFALDQPPAPAPAASPNLQPAASA